MTGRRLVGCSLAATVGLLLAVVLLSRARPLALELGGGSEVVYSVSGGSPEAVARVLEKRLASIGFAGISVEPVVSGQVGIKLPGLHPDEIALVRKVVETRGQLDFKLVVDKQDPEMGSQAAVDAAIRGTLAKKSDGSWRAYQDDDHVYDHWDVAYDKASGKPLLLDNRGVPGSLLVDAHRSLDAAGRPAIGFEFGKKGRDRFYDFTSKNVNRVIAIVLDGIVQSAPVIRSAIGGSGIIEGGAQGFGSDEVRGLVAVLRAGALPARVSFVQSIKVGAAPGPAVTQAAIALAVSAALMGGILALTLPGQPTTARETT